MVGVLPNANTDSIEFEGWIWAIIFDCILLQSDRDAFCEWNCCENMSDISSDSDVVSASDVYSKFIRHQKSKNEDNLEPHEFIARAESNYGSEQRQIKSVFIIHIR